jgi:chromosome segregation ATPase
VQPAAPVDERLERLVAWLGELDSRVRAAELATGDEKTAKELRKAVEAIAKHDPKRLEKLQNHVGVLTDRVATLAGTVATSTATVAGKEGELAALRRELAQLAGRVEGLARPPAPPASARELDELRRAVAQLSQEREKRVGDGRIAGVEEKLRLLTERLDSVSGTVSNVAASVGGRDGELAALRKRVEEESARIEIALAELRRASDPTSLGELRTGLEAVGQRVAALADEARRSLVSFGVDLDAHAERLATLDAVLEEAAARAVGRDAEIEELREQGARRGLEVESLEQGLEHVGGELARVARQLETMDGVVAALADAQAGERSEAAALVSRFESGSARVEGLVRELQQALETMPTGPDPHLVEAVEGHEERLEAIVADVERLGAAADTERAEAEDEARRLRALVDALGASVAATEEARRETGEELDRLGTVLEELRARVESSEIRMEDLVARGPDPELDTKVETLLSELSELGGTVETATGAYAADRRATSEQLDRLSAALEELRIRATADDEQGRALGGRIEAGSARTDEIAAELREALGGQTERLTGLAARIERLDAAAEAGRTAADDQSQAFHDLLERLAERVAAGEREHATLGARDSARLDELAVRLEAIERREAQRASSLEPLADEGRHRVELRALELRMEHAETEARETRDAVLAQIERLARRIESRLQKLEPQPEPVERPAPTVVEGQVVPIRSGEA